MGKTNTFFWEKTNSNYKVCHFSGIMTDGEKYIKQKSCIKKIQIIKNSQNEKISFYNKYNPPNGIVYT